MSAPALSTGNSILTCSAVTASYVGCLYLFSTHRISSGKGDRDDAQIIKHRLQVASASTAASVAGCVALLAHTGTGSLYARIAAALCVMGMPFVPDRTADLASSAATGISRHLVSVVFFPLVLTTLPYLASTYSDYLRGGLPLQTGFNLRRELTSLQGLRNYVIVSCCASLFAWAAD